MPTPDTETLAARLRAVERALTDEDATLDPPAEVTSAESEAEAEHAPSPDGGHDEPDTTVERRLYRLEAAVQALRAALDETAGGNSHDQAAEQPDARVPTGTDCGDAEYGGSERGAPGRGASRRTEPRRPAPDGGHWPDDLATE